MFTIFDPIVNALGWVLALFYGLIPDIGNKQNYALGISIILLTFTIMLILYPLTAKQAKSMIRMQMVQPEIKRLQAKYKNDRTKLNEEMMKFYQENKINPLAGCLPLLVQMPIFFALFRTLKDTYKHVPTGSELYAALCTPPGAANPVSVNACAPGGKYGSALPTHQKFLGMDLSLQALKQPTTWGTILALLLVLLVMLSGYMQSQQAQKRTPAVNKQMAMITKVLPVFFGFISLNFPAGLVVYFFVSNAWRLGQQEVIFRHIGTAADPKHKSLVNPPKASVVDAESRERVDDDAPPAELEAGSEKASGSPKAGRNGNGAAAAAKPAKAPTKASAKSSSRADRTGPKPAGAAGGVPVVAPGRSGGGLRGLFRPPPPSDPSAQRQASSSTKPAAKPTTKSSGGSTGTTERPGQAGRRTSKKKRKR